MVKTLSACALTGLLILPSMAMAGGGQSNAELERKIEALSQQLDELKAQMSQQKETVSKVGDKVDDMDTMLEEKSDAWDMAARFHFSGDFRTRGDYYNAKGVFHDQYNDTILTNRLRLNMNVKATENLEFRGRLAMYKAWGMQTTPDGLGGGFPLFDGNTTRTPSDSALYVDRAYLNWTNIGGAPIWMSIGRRPTSDGPPAQLRMNADRLATPVAYMDYPFDGATIGYAYNWGIEELGQGRIRFCYGRGFENGLQTDDNTPSISDTDFAGISWDILQKGPRFLYLQMFGAFNLFNYPAFSSDLVNAYASTYYGDQKNLGNLYHTAAVYMDKIGDLNYFLAGGWSHSDPNSNGLFNDYANGQYNTNSEDGYSVYTGIRYDIDKAGLKLGAEFNHGSQYWVAFTPGHDDLYMSKLATRGNAYELYLIYDLPTGEAISRYAKTFIRLGWQHYDYDYSGGFDWTTKPYDLDTETAELERLGMNPVKSADQVYMTFEAYF